VLPNPKVVINHVGVANKLPLGRKKCGRGKPASVVHLLGRAISEYHWLPSVTLLIRKYLRYLRSISDKHSTRYNRQRPTDLNPWVWLCPYPSWLQLLGKAADQEWQAQQHQEPNPQVAAGRRLWLGYYRRNGRQRGQNGGRWSGDHFRPGW
jgi:hypothetical protein